jgi:hypothetical protein
MSALAEYDRERINREVFRSGTIRIEDMSDFSCRQVECMYPESFAA